MNRFNPLDTQNRMTFCSKLALALAAAAIAVFPVGCGIGPISTVSDASPVLGDALQGGVHGGQQPVSSASIQLWAVGATGYGSAASKLGSAVTTNATGGFTLGSYTCPSSSALTYITASGGNPGLGGSTTNSSIQLMAALGACGNLSPSTFININEVTTVAAAFALGQYFTPTFGTASTDSFGAPSTTQGQVGITNAFGTVNNLVSFSSGNAVTSATLTNAGFTVTTTPEATKLYTIANIIAACVNSDGTASSPCPTLFADVVPTGKTAPTDTLQAAVYMSLNPTSTNANGSANNLAALFNLTSSTPPFVGGTQPSDWTLGILYTGSTSTILAQPLGLAIDAGGNVWVASGTTTSMLSELSPTGSPLASVTTIGGLAMASLSPRNIAIDTNGNSWITTSSSSAYVFEYVPGGTSPAPIGLGKSSFGIAIDGNNNVYVGESSSSAGFEFGEFVGGVLNATNEVRFPTVGQATVCTASCTNSTLEPQFMAIDTATPANLWASSGTVLTSSTYVYQLSNIDLSSCGATPYAAVCTVPSNTTSNTYNAISLGTISEPFGLAAGYNGTTPQMWVANGVTSGSGFDQLDLLTLSSSSATVAGGQAYGDATTIGGARYLAVDGSGNVWTANNKQTSGTTTGGSVMELNSAGVVLSSVNSGTSPFNVVGYNHLGMSNPAGVGIDPSGNVWIANNPASGATDASSVFEIVGAASPTVTPIALALKNGTAGGHGVGQKP
ncbi:hypothetical protein SAMN05421770_105162 [Granulicella rosea]|uniref:NHL repeat containing protein n=1 Tax=Granulicella rosea TaxID=474952 RepID=A0A239KS04_9BACT|nr:hypothetical protein [Granulicella rosea]SNT20820.1 hypothetical protein SAMN05421770_105162 [Granulicella rosea]